MATGPIKIPNPEKTGTFTPASGITIGDLRVKQIGKIVEVHFYAYKSTGWGSSELNVGSVSGVTFPPTLLRKDCATGTQAYMALSSAYCFMNGSGAINLLSANASHTYALFDFVYTVD